MDEDRARISDLGRSFLMMDSLKRPSLLPFLRPTFRPDFAAGEANSGYLMAHIEAQDRYVEQLEASLTALNIELESIRATAAPQKQTQVLKSLVIENRNLKAQADDLESTWERRLQDEAMRHAQHEAELRSQLRNYDLELAVKMSKLQEMERELSSTRRKLDQTRQMETTLNERLDSLTEILASSPTSTNPRASELLQSSEVSHERQNSDSSRPRPNTINLRKRLSIKTQFTNNEISNSGPPTATLYNNNSASTEPASSSSSSTSPRSKRISIFSSSGETSNSSVAPSSTPLRPVSIMSNVSTGSSTYALGPTETRRPGFRRTMRRFPSGSTIPRPLILPSSASDTLSEPPSASLDNRMSGFFHDTRDITGHLRALASADHSPVENQQDTFAARAEALRALEGGGAQRSSSIDEILARNLLGLHLPGKGELQSPRDTVVMRKKRPNSLALNADIPEEDEDEENEDELDDFRFNLRPPSPLTGLREALALRSNQSPLMTPPLATPLSRTNSQITISQSRNTSNMADPLVLMQKSLLTLLMSGETKLGGVGWWFLGLLSVLERPDETLLDHENQMTRSWQGKSLDKSSALRVWSQFTMSIVIALGTCVIRSSGESRPNRQARKTVYFDVDESRSTSSSPTVVSVAASPFLGPLQVQKKAHAQAGPGRILLRPA